MSFLHSVPLSTELLPQSLTPVVSIALTAVFTLTFAFSSCFPWNWIENISCQMFTLSIPTVFLTQWRVRHNTYDTTWCFTRVRVSCKKLWRGTICIFIDVWLLKEAKVLNAIWAFSRNEGIIWTEKKRECVTLTTTVVVFRGSISDRNSLEMDTYIYFTEF